MNVKWRKRALGTGVIAAVAGIAVSAGLVATAVTVTTTAAHGAGHYALSPKPVNVPLLSHVTRVPAGPGAASRADQVPVIAYHAMDDRCTAMETTCRSPDYESVSARQFTAEMAWLYGQGYHTVTMNQYLAWLADGTTLLPPHPVLLMADNGDAGFLLGAEPVLYHYRFTLTAVIVTGFADAATTGYCQPLMLDRNLLYDMQQNCGGPNTWNATWPQLRALSPQVYGYALEAGADGHFVQGYDAACPVYYTCMMPGENNAAYERRVTGDITAGEAELARQLHGRVTAAVWTPPYSDLGYTCPNNQCPEDVSTGPHGWLARWAAAHFTAVFVQTASRNGLQNEHFRYEVHSTTTEKQFRQAIGVYLRDKAWSRT